MFHKGLFCCFYSNGGLKHGGCGLKQRSALLAPGGDELQRSRRALDCGYLVFPHRLTAGQLFRESFDTLRYLSLFIGCYKNSSLVAHFLLAVITIPLQHPVKPSGLRPTAYLHSKRRTSVTWTELRDEFERALHAGSVMEKTLLESSQVKSHQPHLGSAVRVRHGELRLDFTKCYLVLGRRREP